MRCLRLVGWGLRCLRCHGGGRCRSTSLARAAFLGGWRSFGPRGWLWRVDGSACEALVAGLCAACQGGLRKRVCSPQGGFAPQERASQGVVSNELMATIGRPG